MWIGVHVRSVRGRGEERQVVVAEDTGDCGGKKWIGRTPDWKLHIGDHEGPVGV
jgi:hypothetical protein